MKRHCTEEQTNVAGQSRVLTQEKAPVASCARPDVLTWVGRQVVWRRHVRRGSAASSGLGSGLGGTRGQHTRENLFHWPGGQNRVSRSPTWRHAHSATMQNQHSVKDNKNRYVHRCIMHRSGSQVPINKQHFSIRSPAELSG